ncbi:hypothetical protein OsccyDRAFT_0542 [Leptolyngbyaceae cyanobacterium JSC-12]|nr:hypothetical protein OsccyDRAFT_0542 [Leptolyngbyaceae cyanobacterium JSC-12]
MRQSFEDELRLVNQSLSKVRLIVVKNRLYVRGHFPPKPGTTNPVRTSLATGCVAQLSGLKIAGLKAKEIDIALLMGKFEWSTYLKSANPPAPPPVETKTVGDWIEAFEKEYWRRKSDTRKNRTYYHKNYRLPFKKIPQDSALTLEVLIDVACAAKPDSSTRKSLCRKSLYHLAEFAGFSADQLKHLRSYEGTYSMRSINEKVLPSDEEILEVWRRIDLPGWKFIYAILAIYGLRPREALTADYSALTSELPLVEVGDDTKTGRRMVFPCVAEGWEEMLSHLEPQAVEFRGVYNEEPGATVLWYHLKKRPRSPFSPYSLRHCYGRRMFLQGHPSDLIAKSMGHSEAIHRSVYRAWWGQEPYNQRYLETMKRWKERQKSDT